MMSREFYLVLHMTGIFFLLSGLGGIAIHLINGGTRNHSARKAVGMTHGIGLLLVLIGGFGLIAKLGLMQTGFPGWAIAKLVIWLLLGGLPALMYRQPKRGQLWMILYLVLAITACTLGTFKPDF